MAQNNVAGAISSGIRNIPNYNLSCKKWNFLELALINNDLNDDTFSTVTQNIPCEILKHLTIENNDKLSKASFLALGQMMSTFKCL